MHSWSNRLFTLACSGLHVPQAHIGVDRVVLLTEGITRSCVQRRGTLPLYAAASVGDVRLISAYCTRVWRHSLPWTIISGVVCVSRPSCREELGFNSLSLTGSSRAGKCYILHCKNLGLRCTVRIAY